MVSLILWIYLGIGAFFWFVAFSLPWYWESFRKHLPADIVKDIQAQYHVTHKVRKWPIISLIAISVLWGVAVIVRK